MSSKLEKPTLKRGADCHEWEQCAPALLQEELEEEQRLEREYYACLALEEELEHDQNSDWLRGYRWPVWFRGQPLGLLVVASQLPSLDQTQDLVMGTWHGLTCTSSAADEQVLRGILCATESVFTRCEATLQETPRFLPYPFEALKRESGRRRYRNIWRRYVCYLFRMSRLARRLQERLYDLCGLHMNSDQTVMLESVWVEFTKISQGHGPDVLRRSPHHHLQEKLFQFFIMLWTDISHDGGFERSIIVHFSGVLGIHPSQELAYRSAYDYTPFLSALIWVGRLRVQKHCILVGELVVWSDVVRDIMPFYKIRRHVTRAGRRLGCERDSSPDPDEHLMIVFYDILLWDDHICIYETYKQRG
ncbi:hypothetical protein LTR70_010298 [Exophiala xenobiotica]|uniref:Uncharacterized protein n=1 Tax=Lithohypha guttulata TaxID=1690604 RepID=A0ABR0JUF5_9EURO|nr:hypothetical protein LTR24_010285 [Lithohypha guttulata]KAK5309426.1 hypothetical protein LTR70_010298 [Exophiala xenobiotica]